MNRKRVVFIAIALLLGIYVFLVSPLEEKRASLKEQIESRYMTLNKHEKFILRTKNADVELKEAKKELEEMEQYIIKASDLPLAYAELQSKIQDIADSAGLDVNSIKPLPAVDYKGYKGLPIYMDATGDIRRLSRFLNHLDSTWEFISVDKINVASMSQDLLRIKVQLSGLMKT